MLVVETIAKIRRAFFKQGKPIKAICRELGVSRKVVRKVIRSGATEFRYQREDISHRRRLGVGGTRLIEAAGAERDQVITRTSDADPANVDELGMLTREVTASE